MKKSTRLSILMAAILGFSAGAPVYSAETLGTVSIVLPKETMHFRQGPGIEAADKNCTTCHSADYIYMQPPLSKEQWHAEVAKMRKVYGASIKDGDIEDIVDYLVSQNGK
jgi:hypothetical protein